MNENVRVNRVYKDKKFYKTNRWGKVSKTSEDKKVDKAN